MFKQFIKKYLPHPKKIKEEKGLHFLGKILHDPNLFHLNRYSIPRAFAIGLFAALIPLPLQMAIAAVLAVIFKANLPIAICLVWISNPFTTPAIAYFCYRIGVAILGIVQKPFHFEFSLTWLSERWHDIGEPFIVGSIVVAVVVAIISFFVTKLLIRVMTHMAWNRRQEQRKAKKG